MRLGLWMLVKGLETRPEVEGEKATPEETKAMLAWDLKAGKAAGELFLAIEPDQRTYIAGLEDDPVALWAKLQSVHLQKHPGSRFLSYDNFFSIKKKEDESLASLMTRIEEAMIQVKNLRPSSFTLDDLDNELVSMAMIRALPSEFDSFASSLQLLDKLEKSKLQEAFIGEDLCRQHSFITTSPQLISLASHTSPNSSTTICSFCSLPGHLQSSCYRFKAAQAEATKEALEKRQKRKEKGRGGPRTSQAAQAAHTPLPASTTSTPNSSEVVEFAGNASTRLPDPSDPLSPLELDAHVDWTADTGATSHMTPHRHWLRNYTPCRIPIRLADHSIVFSAGVGSVVFIPKVGEKVLRSVEFTRVLHVPHLKNNLLSVLYLARVHQFHIHIYNTRMDFSRGGQLLFYAPIDSSNTACLAGSVVPITQFANVSSVSTLPQDLSLWHHRLAHFHYQGVKTLISKGLVTGITLHPSTSTSHSNTSTSSPISSPDPICEPCLAGKMHAHPFPTTHTITPRLLGLVHSDLHGPLPVQTHSGFKYWITFIDDRSKFKAVVPLKAKSEAFSAFQRFRAYARTKHNLEIGELQDDKGGEYMSKEFDNFCLDHGIVRRHTVRNRPQQNGVAERFNRTLGEGITTMLAESYLPLQFWGEALAALVHTHNR